MIRDNGFRNLVAGNFQPLAERTDRGILNENYTASQLLKSGHEVKYWRTKSHAEIDFIMEEEGAINIIEVKSLLSTSRAGRALFSFREKYPVKRSVILSENFSSFDKKRDILFLPLFFI